MNLPHEAVVEFQQLFKTTYNQDLPFDLAEKMATNLLKVADLISQDKYENKQLSPNQEKHRNS